MPSNVRLGTSGVGPIDPAIPARLQQDNERRPNDLSRSSPHPPVHGEVLRLEGKLLRDVADGTVPLAAGDGLSFSLFSNTRREHQGALYQPPRHDHRDLRSSERERHALAGRWRSLRRRFCGAAPEALEADVAAQMRRQPVPPDEGRCRPFRPFRAALSPSEARSPTNTSAASLVSSERRRRIDVNVFA